MTRLRLLVNAASRLLLAAGILSLTYVVYVAVETSTYQADQRRIFADARAAAPTPVLPAPVPASSVAEVEAPPAVAIPLDGAWLGEIEIRRLGIDVGIVQGESTRL